MGLLSQAFIFDRDGVVTNTAAARLATWKPALDDFLRQRSAAGGHRRPFSRGDYRAHAAGISRYDAGRGISILVHGSGRTTAADHAPGHTWAVGGCLGWLAEGLKEAAR